jgi:hypothetical protein
VILSPEENLNIVILREAKNLNMNKKEILPARGRSSYCVQNDRIDYK